MNLNVVLLIYHNLSWMTELSLGNILRRHSLQWLHMVSWLDSHWSVALLVWGLFFYVKKPCELLNVLSHCLLNVFRLQIYHRFALNVLYDNLVVWRLILVWFGWCGPVEEFCLCVWGWFLRCFWTNAYLWFFKWFIRAVGHSGVDQWLIGLIRLMQWLMGIHTLLGVDLLEQSYILSGNIEQLLLFLDKPRIENVLFSFIWDILMFEDLDSFLYFNEGKYFFWEGGVYRWD